MLRGQQVAYTLCTQGMKPHWQSQHIMALQACLVCTAAGNWQQMLPCYQHAGPVAGTARKASCVLYDLRPGACQTCKIMQAAKFCEWDCLSDPCCSLPSNGRAFNNRMI